LNAGFLRKSPRAILERQQLLKKRYVLRSHRFRKERNSHLFVPVAGAFWINYQRVSTAQRIHALVKRAFLRLRIPETSHKSIATINVV